MRTSERYWSCPICGRLQPKDKPRLVAIGNSGKLLALDLAVACRSCLSRVHGADAGGVEGKPMRRRARRRAPPLPRRRSA